MVKLVRLEIVTDVDRKHCSELQAVLSNYKRLGYLIQSTLVYIMKRGYALC